MENFKHAVREYEKIDQFELFELTNPFKLDDYQLIENAPEVRNHLNIRVKNFDVKPIYFTFIDHLLKLSNEKTKQKLPENIILFYIINEHAHNLRVIYLF